MHFQSRYRDSGKKPNRSGIGLLNQQSANRNGRAFTAVLEIEDDAIERLIASQAPLEAIELVEMEDGGNIIALSLLRCCVLVSFGLLEHFLSICLPLLCCISRLRSYTLILINCLCSLLISRSRFYRCR